VVCAILDYQYLIYKASVNWPLTTFTLSLPFEGGLGYNPGKILAIKDAYR